MAPHWRGCTAAGEGARVRPSRLRLRAFVGVAVVVFAVGTGPAASEEDSDWLQAILDRIVPADGPGLVAAVRGPQGVAVAASGLANIATAAPLVPDSAIRIASASKPLVATVVLQLVEQGLVDLDAPVADFLDPRDVADIANAERATVRQVLNMTSGVPEYMATDAFEGALSADVRWDWTARRALAMVAGEPAFAEPGDVFDYSNSNYVLIQILIETVTGRGLGDELAARIFTPLGMERTFLETPDRVGLGPVRGYEASADGPLLDVTDVNDAIGLADGGVVSTAGDLSLFLPALFAGRLISEDTLRDDMLDFGLDDEGEAYGLGLAASSFQGEPVFGHDGATTGFSAEMLFLPRRGLSVVLLSNDAESDVLDDVLSEILDFDW